MASLVCLLLALTWLVSDTPLWAARPPKARRAAGGALELRTVPGGFEFTADHGRPDSDEAGAVLAATFLGSERALATATGQHRVALWQVTSAARVALTRELRHEGPVVSLAASADGRLLAGAAIDHGVRVWRAPTGQIQVTIAPPPGRRLLSAAFSPDGTQVVTGEALTGAAATGAAIRVWDSRSGVELSRKEVGAGATGPVLVAPDGRYLLHAAPGGGHEVYVRTANNGEVVGTLRGHNAPASLALDARGARLLGTATSGAGDGELLAWRLPAGPELATLRAPGLMIGGAWLPHGPLAVTAGLPPAAPGSTLWWRDLRRKRGAPVARTLALNTTCLAVDPRGLRVALGGTSLPAAGQRPVGRLLLLDARHLMRPGSG